jgi:hypothetical protein
VRFDRYSRIIKTAVSRHQETGKRQKAVDRRP